MSARNAAIWRLVVETRSRWPRLALSVALAAGAVAASAALLAVAGYLVSRASQQPQILLLTAAIVGVRFFGISRALLRYFERLSSHELAFRALTDIRVRFFRRLAPLVPGAVKGSGRADLLSRFVADADRLQDLYLRALLPPLVALVAGAGLVIAAGLILPAAAAVLLAVFLAAGILVPILTRRLARRAGRNQSAARAALGGVMVEIVGGAPEIAVAGREHDWEVRSSAAGRRLAGILRRDAVAGGFAVGSAAALSALAAVAMAAVAIPAVADGSLAGVLLAALVLLAIGSLEVVTPMGQAAASIDAVAESAARLDELTSAPDPAPAPTEPVRLPVAGGLAVHSVASRYEAGPWVLEEADLTLAPREAVALTGASGSGKSTLAQLLVRFRDPDRGSVTLGRADLRDLDPDELRAAVRLGSQDCYLFATTIRDNVALANGTATDAEITHALARAGLGPWIASLPQGIDTLVGEAGAQVSGGQRQRIAAARLFAASARFLIFDEPTTHLDPAGARDLLARTAALAHRDGRGVLVITHETEGLEPFDRVLELRGGRLG